jgi:hypothetical protein
MTPTPKKKTTTPKKVDAQKAKDYVAPGKERADKREAAK